MNVVEEINKKPKEREYLFDNYKAFLIVLVVIGHFIEPSYKQNTILYDLKWAIVAFHMPAFIFISGYFSKKTPSIVKLIRGLAIPYLVCEVIYYLLYTYILHIDTELYLSRPKFSLWYLMALFVWKLLTPIVKKVPGYMVLTIVGGLLIGMVGLDNYFSIPRIVFFFPFFLAGECFDKAWLDKLRDTKGFIIASVGLVGFAVFLLTDKIHDKLTPHIFYGRYSYDVMGFDTKEGMIIRIVCYAISFLLVYLFMMVVPNEKKSYSYLGQRTMPVYIFHGLVYSFLKFRTDILSSVESNLECFALIISCIVLVWVLAQKPFVKFTNRISNLI